MPKMTYSLTVWIQCIAGFLQVVIPAAAPVLGWSSAETGLAHAIIGGLQTVQAVLAHGRDKEGYKLPEGFSPMKPIEGPKGDVE